MSFIWTPLLESMSVAARTAWPFIVKAAGEGLEGEDIISAMREAGIPTFRRQDMLALVRQATTGELLKSDIRRWPVDAMLPIDRVRESVTKIVAPFSYTLRVTVEDEDGFVSVITRQAHSQELENFSTVADRFTSHAAASAAYESFEVLEVEVTDVQRSGPLGVI